MSFNANVKKEQGINNLKQAGRNFKDAGEYALEDAGENLVDKAAHAGEEVRRYISNATDRVTQAGSELEHTIQQKPVQSSVIALCAGIVLGMLLRR